MFNHTSLEQIYLKLTTTAHRKHFAQFFTPSMIASLMGAYILDNPKCKTILDPANGLSTFARAIDENLSVLNSISFYDSYQRQSSLCYKFDFYQKQKTYSYTNTYAPLYQVAHILSYCPKVHFPKHFEYFFSSLSEIHRQKEQHKTNHTKVKPNNNNYSLDASAIMPHNRVHENQINLEIKPGSNQLDYSFTNNFDYKVSKHEYKQSSNKTDNPQHLNVISETYNINDFGLTPNSQIRTVKVTAFEIDPIICEYVHISQSYRPYQFVDFNLKSKDFLKSSFKTMYDGIICNPPYLSFKDIENKESIIASFENTLKINLSGKVNIYILFLLKALTQLNPDGRCAFLIPYEFLNSSFGVPVKKIFIEQKKLAYVITFDIKGQIFDNVTTTCGLFLFDNSQKHEHIEFITVHSLDEVAKLTLKLCPHLMEQLPKFDKNVSALYSNLNFNCDPSTSLNQRFSQATINKQSKINSAQELIEQSDQAVPTEEFKLKDKFTPASMEQTLLLDNLEKEPEESETEQFHNYTQNIHYEDIQHIGSKSSYTSILYDLQMFPKQNVDSLKIQKVSYKDLNPEQKWHQYYQNNLEISAHLQHKHKIKNSLACFDKFIKVKRGLATGANDFFLFNQSKIKKTLIPLEYFVPVIPRATLVKHPFLFKSDFDNLVQKDANVFLLNAPEDLQNPELKKYINLGVDRNIHQRYLTRHRTPWYILEKKQIAPILVSVFNRGHLQIVRNEANIYNLTAFHSLFVLDKEMIDLIFAYLITPLAKEIILQNRREYGGGLKKLEPLDIAHASCIDFNLLNSGTRDEILKLYAQYRQAIIENQEIKIQHDILNQINQCFKNAIRFV